MLVAALTAHTPRESRNQQGWKTHCYVAETLSLCFHFPLHRISQAVLGTQQCHHEVRHHALAWTNEAMMLPVKWLFKWPSWQGQTTWKDAGFLCPNKSLSELFHQAPSKWPCALQLHGCHFGQALILQPGDCSSSREIGLHLSVPIKWHPCWPVHRDCRCVTSLCLYVWERRREGESSFCCDVFYWAERDIACILINEIQEHSHLRVEREEKNVCVHMTGNIYAIYSSSHAPNIRKPWGVHVSKLCHQPGLKSQTLGSPVWPPARSTNWCLFP